MGNCWSASSAVAKKRPSTRWCDGMAQWSGPGPPRSSQPDACARRDADDRWATAGVLRQPSRRSGPRHAGATAWPNGLGRVLHDLRNLTLAQDGMPMTDGQLLECFVSRREEAALDTLVRRHGPMVWAGSSTIFAT